jgi:hypothetical protein
MLVWTKEEGYENDGVHQEEIYSQEEVEFRIRYIDADEDIPASGYPRVWVFKDNKPIAGAPFTLVFTGIGKSFDGIYSARLPMKEIGEYQYYFEAKDINGIKAEDTSMNTFKVKAKALIITQKQDSLPTKVYQNYPNPFDPTQEETYIPFTLDRKSYIKIKIYNIVGQLVNEIDVGIKEEGDYRDYRNSDKKPILYKGEDKYGDKLPSGLYFYKFEAYIVDENNKRGKLYYIEIKKLVVLK